MKKDEIILMITVIAVALTMVLSLPYYAVAQESKKSSIADSVRLPLIPKQKFLAGLLIKKAAYAQHCN